MTCLCIVLVAVAALFSTAPAQAAAVRFEFEISGATLHYQWLHNLTESREATNQEVEDFLGLHHTLLPLTQSGRLAVTLVDNGFDEDWRIGCTSDIPGLTAALFCEATPSRPGWGSVGYSRTGANNRFSVVGPMIWAYDDLRMGFSDDANITGSGYLNGDRFLWWNPTAALTVASVTFTELPLPSTGWLLFPALVLFVRRRERCLGVAAECRTPNGRRRPS